MCCLNKGLSKGFLLDSWRYNPYLFFLISFIHVHLIWNCFKVGVIGALMNVVAELLATCAPYLLHFYVISLAILLILIIIFIIVFSDFVFPIFAAYSIFGCFATTPPHFSAVFRLVRSARPVKVFTFLIFLATDFT